MHITGGDHRLIILFSQRHNPFIHFLNIFDGIYIPDLFLIDHEFIISGRLYFQIIIKIHYPGYIRIAFFVQQGPVQLPGLTGTAEYQPFPAFLEQALWHAGPLRIIGQVGFRYQFIQIHSPRIVFSQNNSMIGRQFFYNIRIGISQGVHFGQGIHIILQ